MNASRPSLPSVFPWFCCKGLCVDGYREFDILNVWKMRGGFKDFTGRRTRPPYSTVNESVLLLFSLNTDLLQVVNYTKIRKGVRCQFSVSGEGIRANAELPA